MKVIFESKIVCGRELIYPKNQAAKDLCRLTRKTTFLREDLPILRDLNLPVEWVKSDKTGA